MLLATLASPVTGALIDLGLFCCLRCLIAIGETASQELRKKMPPALAKLGVEDTHNAFLYYARDRVPEPTCLRSQSCD